MSTRWHILITIAVVAILHIAAHEDAKIMEEAAADPLTRWWRQVEREWAELDPEVLAELERLQHAHESTAGALLSGPWPGMEGM